MIPDSIARASTKSGLGTRWPRRRQLVRDADRRRCTAGRSHEWSAVVLGLGVGLAGVSPTVEGMTVTIPELTLNNGVTMPALGLGVFQSPPEETTSAVETALNVGYRHIDTAAAYGNERQVGDGIRRSGLDRAAVFVETKVWVSDYGYDQTLHAFDKAIRKLGVDQLDLLILHQPAPDRFDRPDGRRVQGVGDAAGRRQGARDRGQQLHAPPP